ncbi:MULTISPECIES: hypothetical protein [Cupriavidus]
MPVQPEHGKCGAGPASTVGMKRLPRAVRRRENHNGAAMPPDVRETAPQAATAGRETPGTPLRRARAARGHRRTARLARQLQLNIREPGATAHAGLETGSQ